MSIRTNIEEIQAKMLAEIKKHGPEGDVVSKDVKKKAIAAIMGGAGDWIAYMSLYAKNPAQLARLVPIDGTHSNSDMQEARAYLVANAVCAPATATGLLESVLDRLDTPPVP